MGFGGLQGRKEAVHVLEGAGAPVLLLGWTGLIIGTICMLQIVLSLFLDRPYDRGLLKNYFWAVWYPTIYWIIAAATAAAWSTPGDATPSRPSAE